MVAREAEIGGRGVWSRTRIACISRETVVELVAVLIRIPRNSRVHRASGTVVHNRGNPPVVEEVTQKFMAAVEEARLSGDSHHESVALVRDTGTALGARNIGILDRRRLAGDESVLAVLDGAGVGVGEAEVGSARDPAVYGEGCSVVVARCGTLKFIDATQLGDRAAQGIDARRPWAI